MSRRARGSKGFRQTRTVRRRILLSGWLLVGGVILWRSAELQIVEASDWRAVAERQHHSSSSVPAARGVIRDRDGIPMAVSHDVFRVAVAPQEVGHGIREPAEREAARDEVARLLAQATGLPGSRTGDAVSSSRSWVVLPGRFGPEVREALAGINGVHLTQEARRFYPHESMARGVMGVVIDGMGTGGVEQGFDHLLRGEPGEEILARDPQGRHLPGTGWQLRAPRPGGEVVLTLDVDLQEIAREALKEAVESTGARGGDILITDPDTGEILAMYSLRDGNEAGLSTINAPYEPGSTLKPFTVAALLAHDAASLTDSLDTGNGSWRVAGRTLTDVHPVGRVSLAQALRVSSNVGIAQAAQTLSPAQQYEMLRDFGFGMATGIHLPGESTGLLRRPPQWSAQSPASLAIGYEISVTPLQMAMAYGALANGGRLMEPRIVKELRGPDGLVRESFPPRVVRQVVPKSVTRDVNQVLVDAVEEGTGRRARLSTFAVAGKSGTSRAYGSNGYARGEYFSSFAGFFPAEDPQLVIFVKLESPKGTYYGGATAAPVTLTTMEAVLAARTPPMDRRALATLARNSSAVLPRDLPKPTGDGVQTPGWGAGTPVRFTSAGAGAAPAGAPWSAQSLPSDPASELTLGSLESSLVPDVAGLPVRAAVRRLHAHGFRVEWTGAGRIRGTTPAAGTLRPPGDTVRLLGRGDRD
ncbi:MAG: penicillin-binding transpeptidase domain-containing protein [Gemmatimonadota bacterium]